MGRRDKPTRRRRAVTRLVPSKALSRIITLPFYFPFPLLALLCFCFAFASCSSERHISGFLSCWAGKAGRRSYHSPPRSQGVGSRPRRATTVRYWYCVHYMGQYSSGRKMPVPDLCYRNNGRRKKGAAQARRAAGTERERASVKQQQGQGRGRTPILCAQAGYCCWRCRCQFFSCAWAWVFEEEKS